MIIDFHTHIWPDSLAPKALSSLTKHVDESQKPVTDGTLSGLISRMDEWNIDFSVIQPVITKPTQAENTNAFAIKINQDEKLNKRVLSFGAVWPYSENYKREIDFLAENGIKGIKFHPEYQQFTIDETRFLHIYDYALSKGLMLLFHAGFDPAFESTLHSTPKQFANVVKQMQGGVIVAAHLGGLCQTDDVEKYLVGQNIYLDTSIGFFQYTTEQFERIVKSHGAEKILFASDSPWSNAQKEIFALKQTLLRDSQKEMILGQNAKKLLGL